MLSCHIQAPWIGNDQPADDHNLALALAGSQIVHDVTSDITEIDIAIEQSMQMPRDWEMQPLLVVSCWNS